MAFTRFDKDTDNISKLSNRPNQHDGLSAAQLKGRFDKAGSDIAEFIDSHIDELEEITDGKYLKVGLNTVASGLASTALGNETEASGTFSHAEGYNTKASGNNAHSEGDGTEASGFCSHAEGSLTLASGSCAHAEGSSTIASGDFSHAEGYKTEATGTFSHAEGNETKATGDFAHAEGNMTVASEAMSHAEGYNTEASGFISHAEGSGTKASNYSSHAEGADTVASGSMSHAEGQGTIAEGTAQHVQGQFNVPNPDLAMIIGGGTGDVDRKNILTVDWDGNLGIAGNLDLSAGKKVKIGGQDMSAINIGAVATTDIVNNLTTTIAGKVLDARQGKMLDDKVGANATSIGTLASLTTTEKTNLVGAINELNTDKIETSAIVNGLTETGTGKVLDARQGKVLADIVSTNSTKIASINFNIGTYLDDFIPLGAAWDKGENPTLARTDFAVGKVANIGIDSQVVQNDFDSASIYREIIEIEDTLGNKFVRIPKFYIRKVDINGFKSWQICKYKHPGFYLPWCFWDFANSRELPYIDVGKHNASLNGTKLASVANTYPLINKNIVDFRGYAQANNAGGLLGYQQLDVHVIDVLRTLFFIEFATLNSQSIMRGFVEGQNTATHLATATEAGANRIVVANAHADLYRVGQAISVGTTVGGNQKFYGRTITGITVVDESNKAVEFDGDPVDIATGNVLYNTGWKSGFSSSITASSGCIVANDGKYPCSYRGIENPFGSVWQFADGVNITDNQAWVCKDVGQYASNVFASPYEKLSYVNINATGFGPVEMGYDTGLPFAEFATNVTGGSTSKHYCNYYYQRSESRVALFGGGCLHRLYVGFSCWSLGDNSSYSHIYTGGRLIRKAL